MRAVLPYFMLYIRHRWILVLGITLASITILARIGLLMLSGWFISTSAIVGSITEINYMLSGAGVRVISIIRIVGHYFERLINHDITLRVLHDLRVSLFKKLLPLSPAGLIPLHQEKIFNRVMIDVNTLDHIYLRLFIPLVNTFIIIVLIIGLNILINSSVFIIVSSITILTPLILSLFVYHIGKKNGKNLIHLREKYFQYLIIWLQNQAELTIFDANSYYREKMKKIEFKWYETQRRQFGLIAISKEIVILISNLSILVLLWIISDDLDDSNFLWKNTSITLLVFGTLGTFEILIPIILACQYLGQVITSASHITQIIEQEPKVHFTGKFSNIPSQISLHFNRVSFSYTGQLRNALEQVTFSIEMGTHVLVIGHTGCGKSTLIKMITRAWDPQKGSITINNIPLNQFSEQALRAIISIVPQRVHLFNATLRDNLLLSTSLSKENNKIFSILEQVELHTLLDTNGLDTWLGEGGRQLSGGELRRLAIARALLRNTPLMLLDEPTGELDYITEVKIIKLLKKIMNNKTLLMVTHRLSELKNFNKIIIMDNGKILKQIKNT